MDINPDIATTIVANIKDVLQHEINLFDTHGMIIASTDPARIGTHHAGALKAARDKCTVCVDDTHRYAGAKDGINVPVIIDGDVAAVVGVTGQRSDVEPFGNIIRKMTEILLRENLEQTARYERRMSMSSLINQLISPSPDVTIAGYLASVLDCDIERPRLVAVGRIIQPHSQTPTMMSSASTDELYSVLDRIVRPLKHSLYAVTTRECCLLLDPADIARAYAGTRGDSPTQLLRSLQETFRAECGMPFGFGIGGTARSLEGYAASYRQALTVTKWQRFQGAPDVGSYDSLDVGLLVPDLTLDSMRLFCRRVFGTLDDEAIDAYERTFRVYERHNGSITHAADELFIHKNTLQNHLNALAADTGYNPRTLADFTVLSMAFSIRAYVRFATAETHG